MSLLRKGFFEPVAPIVAPAAKAFMHPVAVSVAFAVRRCHFVVVVFAVAVGA